MLSRRVFHRSFRSVYYTGPGGLFKIAGMVDEYGDVVGGIMRRERSLKSLLGELWVPIYRCSNGRYRIGNGSCKYETLEAVLQAYRAYLA